MTCRGSGCGAVVCHRGLRSAPRSRVRRRPTSPEEADSSDEVPVPESDDSTQTFFWTSDSAPAPYTTCMFQAEYETLGQVCRCRRFGLGCRKWQVLDFTCCSLHLTEKLQVVTSWASMSQRHAKRAAKMNPATSKPIVRTCTRA